MLKFLIMFLTVGFPKVPLLGVPFLYFLPFVLLKTSLRLLKLRVVLCFWFICTLVLILYLIRAILAQSAAVDIIFIFAIMSKFYLAPFIGFFLYQSYINAQFPAFILVQTFLLLLAIAFDRVHEFLLIFQSSAARDVFLLISEQRAIAFGIIHNEGAMFIAFFFYFIAYGAYGALRSVSWLSVFFLAMSRLVGVLIFAILLFKRPISLMAVTLLIFTFTMFFRGYYPSIMVAALEPVVSFFEGDGFTIQSVAHMGTMLSWPQEAQTWIFGDGRFFVDDGSFYMKTDLGFLRIIYFSGVLGLLVFLLLSLWPAIFCKSYRFELFIFMLLSALAFIKGLNSHPWIFFFIYFLSHQKFIDKASTPTKRIR